MHVFQSSQSSLHDPKLYFRRDKTVAHPENVERLEVLKSAIRKADFAIHECVDLGDHVIEAVHDAGYLQFLKSAWERRGEIDAGAEELLTTQFSRQQMHRRPEGLAGLFGYYTADTSTPIRAGTWQAIYGSAQVAANTADAALMHGRAYALCRPPGHHAFADCAGGFCFLNNAAVAAQRLRERTNGPVAILDIDVHHGNGTQGIFYQRADVLTVSIHADPSNYFPHYAGYAEETGVGAALGFNLNMPLAHGSGDTVFLSALAQALDRIANFKPAALVIALGLDASEHDPLGVFKVTRHGFEQAATMIAAPGWPTALVQEGGYLCEALPLNLVAFLKAFDKAHRF